MPVPEWLRTLAAISLAVAVICAALIAIDIMRGHRQRMWIMDIVWPVTALWSGPLGLWAYLKLGRMSVKGRESPQKPFWQSVGLGATHCGSGCTLADLIVEWFVFFVPISIFGYAIFGTWVADFIVAFLLGIAFQYFTIAPMRDLSLGQGLLAAVKADTLSLSAWQVGMYGWMAVALFLLFSPEALPKTGPTFWFMMQIAMVCGFLCSYPVNWWLLRRGLKERM